MIDLEKEIQTRQWLIVQVGEDSCLPCKRIREKIQKFLHGRPSVAYLYLPLEGYKKVLARFDVYSVPAVLFFVEGKQYQKVAGYFSVELFLEQVERWISLSEK